MKSGSALQAGWLCSRRSRLRVELPARLAAGPRVIKRNRGNGGQGVWKVETLASRRNRPMVGVLDATKDASEELALDEFLERCVEYFEDGCVIDQPFQARLSEGVVRCYMAGDRCAGFGHQKVKALVDAPAARAAPARTELEVECGAGTSQRRAWERGRRSVRACALSLVGAA